MKKLFGPRNREEAEVYAIVGLRAKTQYCIQSVMNAKKVSRSELARRLDCSPANVSQMLSEYSNLTLESVAKIFFALDDTCIVKSRYLESGKESARAANEDNYAIGSFRIAGRPIRPARRIAVHGHGQGQGQGQGSIGAFMWGKAPAYFETIHGMQAANLDNMYSNDSNVGEEAGQYADAA